MSSSGWLWPTGCHHSRVPPSRRLGGTVGVAIWNVNRVTHSKFSGGGKKSKPMTSKVPIVFTVSTVSRSFEYPSIWNIYYHSKGEGWRYREEKLDQSRLKPSWEISKSYSSVSHFKESLMQFSVKTPVPMCPFLFLFLLKKN